MPKGFPNDVAKVARRKLRMLESATRLEDLRNPPGNRLETLVGDRTGQHSIRVNDQRRVCSFGKMVTPTMSRSSTTIRRLKVSIRAEDVLGLDLSDVAGAERIGPVVPGEVLHEEFMMPLGLSGRALARELGVPSNRITEIVAGERTITAETAIFACRAVWYNG